MSALDRASRAGAPTRHTLAAFLPSRYLSWLMISCHDSSLFYAVEPTGFTIRTVAPELIRSPAGGRR